MAKSGSITGGIIGKVNKASFGKCTTTTTNATATLTTQPGTRVLDALIVAGGGAGGGTFRGGGGGAGGYNCQTMIPVCGPTPIVVGAGGTAVADGNDVGDTSSIATTFTATGGGGGGLYAPPPSCKKGEPGGSGGGGAGWDSAPITAPEIVGGCGVACQGNPGGAGSLTPGIQTGGGGGGAGGAGCGTGPQRPGGAGSSASPLSCTVFSGGGGAGAYGGATAGAGGSGNAPGSGGCGPPAAGGSAQVNTGGGGGGAAGPPSAAGGNGGSGLVITKELSYTSGMWPQQAQFQSMDDGTWPLPPAVSMSTINLLVIAGGGGGAGGQSGGSGAGGYRFCTTFPIAPGNTYKVTVGGGGAATTIGARPGGSSGVNSSFDTLGVGCTYSATGGGVGVYGANPQPYNTPLTAMGGNPLISGPGGSGGGRGESNIPNAGAMTGNKGGYPVSEGNDGGVNWSPPGQYGGPGGGGGGAGAVGTPIPINTTAGAGGAGSSAWPGDCTLRAGGGGGGNGSAIYSSGAGGPGGGGKGGNTFPAPAAFGGAGCNSGGQTNTGGGAGAAGQGAAPCYTMLSTNGGPGIVKIQFPDAFACKGITGGSPACGAATPGCTHTHTFLATGCFVIPF